jgi:hypothetical protein
MVHHYVGTMMKTEQIEEFKRMLGELPDIADKLAKMAAAWQALPASERHSNGDEEKYKDFLDNLLASGLGVRSYNVLHDAYFNHHSVDSVEDVLSRTTRQMLRLMGCGRSVTVELRAVFDKAGYKNHLT